MESKLTSNDYMVLRELVGKEIERCVDYEQSSERGPSRDFWRDLSCFYIKMLERFPREDNGGSGERKYAKPILPIFRE